VQLLIIYTRQALLTSINCRDFLPESP